MTGIVPYTSLNVSSPASEALLQIGLSTAASALVAAGVIVGLTTVMLVLYYASDAHHHWCLARWSAAAIFLRGERAHSHARPHDGH